MSLVRSLDKRIPLPGADAKPEEWDEVYTKLGRPEKPDGYKFEFPADAPWDDTHKDRLKGLAPIFHAEGATQKQVDAYLKRQAELDKLDADAHAARVNTLTQTNQKALRTRWGADYDENRNMAATSVKHYAGSSLDKLASMRLADGTFMLDDPDVAEVFAKVGRDKSEDMRDPTAFNSTQRASVTSQIEAIKAEMREKGISPSDTARYPHAKLEELYAKASGTRNEFAG